MTQESHRFPLRNSKKSDPQTESNPLKLEGGPLLVINRVIFMTPISGVTTLLVTGRYPPCTDGILESYL